MERPGVAAELQRIHRTVTRALIGAVDHTRSHRDDGLAARDRPAFATFLQAVVTLVHAHHSTEDDEAFPAFRDRMPEAPWDALEEQHRDMAGLLGALDRDIESLRGGGDAPAALASAAGHLERLIEVWRPHIETEETWFSADVLDRISTPIEEQSLIVRFAEHSRSHMVPGQVMLPFLLYHLPAADRVHLERTMPWMLKRVLVPIAWRKHWAPIARYLPYAPGGRARDERRAA